MPQLFDDSDIVPREHIAIAIEAVGEVLRERAAKTAAVQRRSRLEAGGNALVLTPGALGELGIGGLRVYPIGGDEPQQLVAVWELGSGRLKTLFLGSELGVLRTGAIGGVALSVLAPHTQRPLRIAVVGAGRQALMQMRAALAVRRVECVTLHRRDRASLRSTSARWSRELGCEVRPVDTAREAVAEADAVILATGATHPLVEPEWMAPNAFLASLGPKRRDRSEISLGLLDRASRIVSDFPEQHADDPEHIGYGHEVEDLANAFVESRSPASGLTVFLSHGLAGTEVAVADALARSLRD